MYFKNAIFFICMVVASQVEARNYYVSTQGMDTNDGSITKPFATLQKAQSYVQPGDTVYLRGGEYIIRMDQIMTPNGGLYAYVFDMKKSGTKEKPICYFAYPGDKRPVFNFKNIRPDGLRVSAFNIGGDYLHLKGFDIVGVQVTIKGHTQSEGISFHDGNGYDIIEQVNIHDGMAIGVYIKRGHDNLILNCDAYNNYDSLSEKGKGGNSDGFGCHVPEEYTGNIFRGCRAWRNSDDGFDLIHCYAPVIFDHCWSVENGYDKNMIPRADGNGFKAGGYGKKALPNPIITPRHTIVNCIAAGNKANGFYANHHLGGNDWINNSASENKVNFCMTNQKDWSTPIDIAGYDHLLKNNLSFGSKKEQYSMIDTTRCHLENNTFLSVKYILKASDFESLDIRQLLSPRLKDGSLPKVSYLKIMPSSTYYLRNVGCKQ